MKIAFAIGEYSAQSGIVKVTVSVADELSKIPANEVYLITTGCNEHVNNKTVCEGRVGLINLDIERYGHRGRYLKYTEAISAKVSHYHFDLIVVSGTEHVIFYDTAFAHMKYPHPKLIVWEHRNFYAGPLFRLEWIGKRIAIKRWDGILSITKKDYEQYSKHMSNTEKLYQIYNLIGSVAEKTNYQTSSKRIISCGTLSRIKGFDMLVDVAEIVFKKHPEWTWDIYGEGEEHGNLEKLIAKKGLQKNVYLKGYTDNIKKTYPDYSIFVFTSRAEGMGMVLVEALKSGLPIVSFDIKCGPSDVITDGINGYLIEPFSISKMSERINQLIENRTLRGKFSAASGNSLDEFNRDLIIKKWSSMITAVCNESS